MACEIRDEVTPSGLEFINKNVAKSQARAINKGLTRLRRISSHPAQAKIPEGGDRTERFIVVPVDELVNKEIEEAYEDARQHCATETEPPPAKKKWFQWR